MTAVRFTPEATYIDPIIGWRFWRVEKIQTLDGVKRFRLCAAGYAGLPKVWQPRAATSAYCSSSESTHDAPHPMHECGIHAYRDESDAEAKLASFAAYKRACGERSTWAFGRVQLWGRVVECELGWRAQFGYPYALTLFGGAVTASSLAADYAIDVEREPSSALSKLLRRHPDDVQDGTNDADYDSWYETSLYGVMDRSFLRPYHEEVMGRLDELLREVRRLTANDRAGPG